MNAKRTILGAVLLAAAVATPSPAASPPKDPGAAIDRFANPLVDRGDLSGQLLVLRNGKVIVERNYGKASLELDIPITPDTRFNIASVTKPMTSTLAIHLLEKKTIGLRDPVSRWIKDFPKGDSITVEHLLRHRSGIPHELVPDSAATVPRTAAEMVEIAKKLPLDFPPGSKSSYSSGGFSVLARILEIASGKSYGDLLQEEIFGPLGMTNSAHIDGRTIFPERAAAYVPGPDGIENAPYQDFSGLVGAGSVWSTARDLDKFVQAVVSGKLGEGVKQSFVRDGRLSFNGRTGGFKAFADRDTTGLEVIFLSNVSTGAVEVLQAAIPKILAGENVTPPSPPQGKTEAPPVADLRRLEGTFQLGNGIKLVVRVRNGTLYANDWVLRPAADGAFFSPRDYGIVGPVKGAEGGIERLDWKQGDQVYPAPRIGN